jgi:ATP-binding cassette subfamily B protein
VSGGSSPRTELRWWWSRLRPHRWRIAALAALSTAEIALRLLSPWAMMVVIDHALGHRPLAGVTASVAGALGVGDDPRRMLIAFATIGVALQLVHQLAIMAHSRISVVAGQHLVRELRERLFAHTTALALQHHASTPTGDSVQRLADDTRCIEQLVLRGLFPLAFSILTLFVMFALLLEIDAPLAILACAVVPPLYLWLRFSSRRIGPRADDARRTDSRLSSRVYESLASIRLVKSHAREDHEQERFAAIAGDAARAWIDVGYAGTVLSVVTGALTVIGTSLVLIVGGLAVLDGRITIGTLLLVLAYLGYTYGPLQAIVQTTGDLQQALASARRVRAAFALVAEPVDAPDTIAADGIRGEIRFDRVSFAYGERRVLDEVSFTARPGETIALIGPSGAGKSTLASLIVRFHDVSGGTITIDGVPIERYRLRSLRRRVAFVLQDALLMSGTVRETLRYGDLTASEAQLQYAACAAHAHEFIIELPRGYDTVLGEHGAGLSGGQRQRLSLARAFVADAPILVLDEPTAALDTISETAIVDALRRLCAKRTTLVIAHRLSTVQAADRILVMDAGRIVAEGTHAELLASSALYRRLARQLTADDVGGGAPATAQATG